MRVYHYSGDHGIAGFWDLGCGSFGMAWKLGWLWFRCVALHLHCVRFGFTKPTDGRGMAWNDLGIIALSFVPFGFMNHELGTSYSIIFAFLSMAVAF